VACSTLGLTDGMEPPTCIGEVGFCDDLNELYPTEDPCLSWACDRDSGYCDTLPTDADGDGALAPGCSDVGDVDDCDDGNGDRYPGAAEICDGVDNDCDDVIDEGACP
jgi:hypothetical protein